MTVENKNQEDLLAKYRQLNPLEQMALQLIAVFYEPISRSMLAKLLVDLDSSPAGRKIASSHAMSGLLDPLVKQGVLTRKDDDQTPRYFCPPIISWEIALEAKQEGLLSKMETAMDQHAPAGNRWQGRHLRFWSFERFVRVMRVAILSDNQDQFHRVLSEADRDFDEYLEVIDPISEIFQYSRSFFWFTQLSQTFRWSILSAFFKSAIENLSDIQPVASMLNELIDQQPEAVSPDLLHWKVVMEILNGRLDQAEQILYGGQPVLAPLCLQGWIHTLRGDTDSAIRAYEETMETLKKRNKNRKTFLYHPSGPFFILALLARGSDQDIISGEKHLLWLARQPIDYRAIYGVLMVPTLILSRKTDAAIAVLIIQYTRFCDLEENTPWNIDQFLNHIEPPTRHSLTGFFLMLGLKWSLPETTELMAEYLVELQKKARMNGFALIADAIDGLMPGNETKPTWNPAALIRFKERWELALERLESQFLEESLGSRSKKSLQGQRLIWIVHTNEWSNDFTVQPKLQKRTAKGAWSKGRNIALKQLKHGADSMPWLTAQDLRACASIEKLYTGWGYNSGRYEVDSKRAILALVGHPLVFWEESPTIPVEVVQSDPGFHIHEEDGTIRLSVDFPAVEEGIIVVKESANRCNVIKIEEDHVRLALAIGSSELIIPAREKTRVQRLIGPISDKLEIQTNLSGMNAHLPEIKASTLPHVHLQPYDEGLMMRMMVRPFGDQGPYHPPGQGSPTLIADISGQRQQTHRDLEAEAKIAEEIIRSCPAIPPCGEDWLWTIEDPESCLELLFELREIGERIAVLWPDGETMKVSRSITMENLSLRTSGDNDWFHVEGKINLPDGSVLEMKTLLEAMSERHGRFVPIGDGQFLALTRTFKKRLEALNNLAEIKGRKQRFHHLMLPAINELAEEVGSFETHDGWQERLRSLESAQKKKPRIPKTFEAELRPYQAEGFKWMTRLAAWGAGACLADDMGLGKTLQSLALLITRATEGPALVVAPTSVCMNWMSEARKFAPTLNMIPLGSGNREEVVSRLKPFDVLVCSYTMLQLEFERLQEVDWETVVLDEAQAIKNPSAKRTKAALGLPAKFRLATTGTPIENHLLELWSLFRFLNPGLLGSKESFSKRFAGPIERGDSAVRDQLKQILKPFILRRTKNQVLDDLPPKTEITLHVSLENEEASLYEALRQRAIEKLSDIEADSNQQRLNVLAEITRLRRACCHPSLIVPETNLSGAKLKVFSEVVNELRDNGHRALVFSQFVDHLSILRNHLDNQGISYQYLDGSTPAKKRSNLVNSFQNGDGDLFLISLKAGGFGLNLTGADYVIHH